MNAHLCRATRSSVKLPRNFSISRILIGLLALLSGSLLIASVATAATAADPSAALKSLQSGNAPAIPQVVVTGKRMTAEQKRQFDEAEAVAQKNAGLKFAGMQDSRK